MAILPLLEFLHDVLLRNEQITHTLQLLCNKRSADTADLSACLAAQTTLTVGYAMMQ